MRRQTTHTNITARVNKGLQKIEHLIKIMSTVVLQNAKFVPIEDETCIMLSVHTECVPAYEFHQNVIICDGVDTSEHLIPVTKKPKVVNDLSTEVLYDFELSYVEPGLYRIDKISASEDDRWDDVEPDLEDTTAIVKDLRNNIDRILNENKGRTKKLQFLQRKLEKSNNNVKTVNDVYEELNEYI